MTYLRHLSENKTSEFSQQIFNTSLDGLPHRLEVLKSEKQRNRHEIRQVFIENIQDYLESHEMTTKLKNEITSLGASSKRICKKITGAMETIKKIKEKSHEIENINKRIELYKSFNKQSLVGVFEIEEKIKLCVRFELFQEAFELYMWFLKLMQAKQDKSYDVLKYLRKKLDSLKINIFEYMLLNLKKVKFNTISPILKKMVQSGQYDMETLVPILFSLFFYFAVKHKVDKVSFQKTSTDNIPLVLTNYPKSFDKVLRLLIEIFGEEASIITEEANTKLLAREFYKFERILKFVLQGSDETLILKFGAELTRTTPHCFINFRGMVESQITKLYQNKMENLNNKLQILFRVSKFQNSFEKFLLIDADSMIARKPNDTDKTKKVVAYEAISTILKEKRGAEYLQILCNNFQALYTYHSIYHQDRVKELTEQDYQKLKTELTQGLTNYMNLINQKNKQEYMEKFDKLESFLYSNLLVCIS